jgi:hypothetical protein
MIKSELRRDLEPKYLDQLSGLTATTQAYQLFGPFTDPPQGDSDSTRSGDQISPISLDIKIQMTPGQISSCIRIFVFRWKQSSVVAPTPSTVLNVSGSAQTNPLVYPAIDFMQNVVALHDKIYPLGINIASGAVSMSQTQVRFNVKVPAKIQFNAAAQTATNHIYMAYCTDASATQPQISVASRLMYHDA